MKTDKNKPQGKLTRISDFLPSAKELKKDAKVKNLEKNEVYVFQASWGKDVFRIFEIQGNNTLYQMAEVIVGCFEFEFDHAFGFYSNLKKYSRNSSEVYELFADMEDVDPTSPYAKGVEKIKIKDVFTPKKKMLFLFDYGDDWEFIIECKGTKPIKPKTHYPFQSLAMGNAPEQYPACEE